MTIRENIIPVFVIGVLSLGLALFIAEVISLANTTNVVDVDVPDLTAFALTGKEIFAANCAACHGKNGAGSEKGPPLVHNIYNPGHHADGAFYLAAKRGVRQHHWQYGSMPPQPQVKKSEMQAIVRYIRELQIANDITFQPHNM